MDKNEKRARRRHVTDGDPVNPYLGVGANPAAGRWGVLRGRKPAGTETYHRDSRFPMEEAAFRRLRRRLIILGAVVLALAALWVLYDLPVRYHLSGVAVTEAGETAAVEMDLRVRYHVLRGADEEGTLTWNGTEYRTARSSHALLEPAMAWNSLQSRLANGRRGVWCQFYRDGVWSDSRGKPSDRVVWCGDAPVGEERTTFFTVTVTGSRLQGGGWEQTQSDPYYWQENS